MHSFARHRHSEASKASATETKGLIGSGGWRYDLMEWFIDTFVFRGQLGELRLRTTTLARLQPGDAVLDVVLSTLMMHHLPAGLKRQGLAEIARVLKPRGRLVIADSKRKQERQGQAARFHAGGSSMQDLAALVKDAGFSEVETEEMRPPSFSAFTGAGIVRSHKS